MSFCPVCLEEDLREQRMTGTCDLCAGPACPEHDRCYGCGYVICLECNSEDGFLGRGIAIAFPGDRLPHPHSERRLGEARS